MVIDNQTVASFTMEALKMTDTSTVSGMLNDEAKVDGDTLITHGGMTRGLITVSSLTKLGLDTDRASVKCSCKRNGGNALCIAMKIRDATRMKMTKTLVPQDAKLIPSQVLNEIFGVFNRCKQ
jgi:hypothetical protein